MEDIESNILCSTPSCFSYIYLHHSPLIILASQGREAQVVNGYEKCLYSGNGKKKSKALLMLVMMMLVSNLLRVGTDATISASFIYSLNNFTEYARHSYGSEQADKTLKEFTS